ncbi:MAG: hypothetical protein K8J31_06795 [Anaerolineae bacterium]|nr:hypothetical protein [Anaerolineae bacterium]
MNTLEQEIIEKFRSLDESSKRRVRLQIEHETGKAAITPMSVEEWLEWARGFGNYVQEKYGRLSASSADLLNEAREERLDDLMGGR